MLLTAELPCKVNGFFMQTIKKNLLYFSFGIIASNCTGEEIRGATNIKNRIDSTNELLKLPEKTESIKAGDDSHTLQVPANRVIGWKFNFWFVFLVLWIAFSSVAFSPHVMIGIL